MCNELAARSPTTYMFKRVSAHQPADLSLEKLFFSFASNEALVLANHLALRATKSTFFVLTNVSTAPPHLAP